MDFHLGRLVALAAELDPLPTKLIRDVQSDEILAHTAATATSTVAPYNTGLAGVNQPMNMLFKDVLWWTLGVLALLVLAVRIYQLCWANLRQISTMAVAGDKQGFWKWKQWSWMPALKKELLYAPLWKKSHNRELKLSPAVRVGTLPSRFHTLMLAVYIGSNLAYMFILDYCMENKYALCAELRGRSGTLALLNIVPLIIFVGRNNPLIGLLQISFDTYNLLHRWIGRVVVIEVIIHTIAWTIVQVAAGGWESAWAKILHDRFIASGTVGTICLGLIAIFSLSPVRHALYETFLNTHILLAFIISVCTWIHCASAAIPGGLPQLPWIVAIILIWLAERVARMVRLVYYNWGEQGSTEATVRSLQGDVCRVTLHLPRYVNVKPGTHAYLRFAKINPLDNHPFSIAWVEHKYDKRVLPRTKRDLEDERPTRTNVSFVIAAQTGFTRKLFDTASSSHARVIKVRAAFEGPYAGHHSLESYGHLVLFAGATGITHQISYVKPLLEAYNKGIVPIRRLLLVWIIREYGHLNWVSDWMDLILQLPNRREILQVKLFVTRPKSIREASSASKTVHMFPGRPNIPDILRKEVEEQMGAMCVSVCGPGALADDVRAATRAVQYEGQVVDFIEESFTW